jgi:uncharacterized protein involved in outer membrane biogenesis
MRTNPEKKRSILRGWWWKIPIGMLFLLILAAPLVVMKLEPLAHRQINLALNRYLAAGGELNQIDIRLFEGAVTLQGLTIHAPKGFGRQPMLSLGELRLDISPVTLATGTIVVEDLVIRDLAVTLIRDKDGNLSPLHLPAETDSASEEKKEPQESAGSPTLPAVRVNTIHLENVTLQVIDHLHKKPWNARLGVDLKMADLRIEDVWEKKIRVGPMLLSVSDVHLDQSPGYGDGHLAALSRLTLETDRLDLSSSNITVKQIHLEEPTASVWIDAEGASNLQALTRALAGGALVIAALGAHAWLGLRGQQAASPGPSAGTS